jgi:hypothetical protein
LDETGKKLLRLLFNDGEEVCPHNTKYSYQSMSLDKAMDGTISLISKNPELPVRYCDSSELKLIAINPIKGFRQDCDVTAYRSFLWEIDTGTIPEQLAYLKKLKIPISAQVFSGGKSVHAVTVLDEDLPDEKTWRYINEWVFKIATLVDSQCTNPSRSVRIPGTYREPGKKQRLIWIGGRVKLQDLMDWLYQYDHLRPKLSEAPKKGVPGTGDYDKLSSWLKKELRNGLDFTRGRNSTWYAVAMDFALAGYDEDEIIEFLGKIFTEERDFKEKEWLTTIRSAFKKATEK